MTPRLHDLCQGVNCTLEQHEGYHRLWQEGRGPGQDFSKMKSRGLGDTIAKITHATGIAKLVRKLKPSGCGCEERQNTLNKWFPYFWRSQSVTLQREGGTAVESVPESTLTATEFTSPEIVEPPKYKWAIGVTTAPRKENYLPVCIASLLAAGFDFDSITIFAEPGSDLTGLPESIRIVQRSERFGCFHNWRAASEQLVKENPTADVILTVQDDAEFAPGSRAYVEKDIWPSRSVGFISLYTSTKYRKHHAAFYRITTESLWGAVALAFPRESLKKMLSHRLVTHWHPPRVRRKIRPENLNQSDTCASMVCNALNLEMWFYTPSLVRHVARFSTINHGGNKGARNCFRWAGDFESLDDAFAGRAPIRTVFTPSSKTEDFQHFILTRSAYPSSYNANRKRLNLTRDICVLSIANQDRRGATAAPPIPPIWIILINPEDPLLSERKQLFESSGLDCVFIEHSPGDSRVFQSAVERLATAKYVLTTRIDDDDALATSFQKRLHAACYETEHPYVISFPTGIRVIGGQYQQYQKINNQFVSVLSPRKNLATCVDRQHGQIEELGPVFTPDDRIAWAWVIHQDQLSAKPNQACRYRVNSSIDKMANAFPSCAFRGQSINSNGLHKLKVKTAKVKTRKPRRRHQNRATIPSASVPD